MNSSLCFPCSRNKTSGILFSSLTIMLHIADTHSRCVASTCAASGVLHFHRKKKKSPNLHPQPFPGGNHLYKSCQGRRGACLWTPGFSNSMQFCVLSPACWAGLRLHGEGPRMLWHEDPQTCSHLKVQSRPENGCGVCRVSQSFCPC